MNINILNVKGRSDLVLRIGLIKMFVNLTILLLTITHGIKVVIIGQIAGSIFGLFPNTYYSKKLIGYGLNEQITDVLKPIFSGSIAGLSAYLVTLYLIMGKIFVLIFSVTTGLLVYFLISYLIKSHGLQIVMRRLKNRSL
jgi:O-antigen/teichoic acid export membrane protein